MAKDQVRRIRVDVLKKDEDSLTALKTISNYKPADPVYSSATIEELLGVMKTQQSAEVLAEKALKTAKDNANEAEWNFHNAIFNARVQVAAQFTWDSNEVQLVGWKKKSEYKRPSKRKKETGVQAPVQEQSNKD